MNTITVNIGLGQKNVSEPAYQLGETLKELTMMSTYIADVKVCEVGDAESNWEGERTLVAMLSTDRSAYETNNVFELMCVRLNQDAISYVYGGKGRMAFNPNYKGERYEFNQDFFKKI